VTDNRPTRDDLAGRAYLELRRAARADGRLTDEYLRLYVLEDALVIKGGVLLAAYDIRRPTADVDIAARDLLGQIDQLRDLVTSIAAQPADDGSRSIPQRSTPGRSARRTPTPASG
jgi:Nucleotidyl transferase AbiEii toxin, Type IV TA system